VEPVQRKLPESADGQLVKTPAPADARSRPRPLVRTVTVIIDHDARYQSHAKPEVGKIILKWLYERVSMHLGDHDAPGIGETMASKPSMMSGHTLPWRDGRTLPMTDSATPSPALGLAAEASPGEMAERRQAASDRPVRLTQPPPRCRDGCRT
jgi:hypothetical protein